MPTYTDTFEGVPPSLQHNPHSKQWHNTSTFKTNSTLSKFMFVFNKSTTMLEDALDSNNW